MGLILRRLSRVILYKIKLALSLLAAAQCIRGPGGAAGAAAGGVRCWRSGRGRWRYRRAWLWRGGGLGVMAGGRRQAGATLARAPNSLAA